MMRADETSAVMFARLARRERGLLYSLLLPGLLVVALLLVPFLWLALASFFSGGEPSVQNYQLIWDNPSYATILLTTFKLSAVVTVAVVLLGYPTAYMISLLPPRWAAIALGCVAIPFWTSLLVRTYAWLVILQRRGLLNSWLENLGLIDHPIRFANSFLGTSIGMVHIMLPFFIFPLYASLRMIDPNLLRAASGLGASPTRAFFGVLLPLSLPGLLAGMLLTFILCLGFYVTPQLLGGGNVTTIAMRIFQNVSTYPELGPASSLGVVLLLAVVVVLLPMARLVSRDRGAGGR